MNRVVITGIGTVNPLGNNIEELWENASKGVNGIAKLDNQDIIDQGVHVGGTIKNLDLLEHFTKKQIRNTDVVILYAIIAARQAAKMANLDSIEDRFRISTCIGSGIGGIRTIQKEAFTAKEKGFKRVSPYFIPNSIVNLVAGNVAIDQNFRGGCSSVVTACSTGTDSIGMSYNNIKFGLADIVVCGSSEAALNEIGIAGFRNIKALSTSEDENRASIPFDEERHGFVMGEGSGVLVLESYESAVNRGAKILGEVTGYFSTCDASHITAPDSEAIGAIHAVNKLIETSGVNKEDINYINCHGTSTKLNEITESKMINNVFEGVKQPFVTSSKSMTGHLLGGAGSVEAIITLLSLNNNLVTPTININKVDEELNIDVTTKPTEANLNYGISSNLAFGGHNSAIMIKGVDDGIK